MRKVKKTRKKGKKTSKEVKKTRKRKKGKTRSKRKKTKRSKSNCSCGNLRFATERKPDDCLSSAIKFTAFVAQFVANLYRQNNR